MEFRHIPVLFDECIEALSIKSSGIYVDATMGGAGHSCGIINKLSSRGTFVGIDKDAEAIAAATQKLKYVKCKAHIIKSDFKNYAQILKDLNLTGVDGVLIDLGVSSHQIDSSERGFSYNQDGPLDMRMNRDDKTSAKDIVNTYSEEELTKIFFKYGEEPLSRRIAKKIVSERKEREIKTTVQLADIIKGAVPIKLQLKNNSVAKIFQALRIETNHELKDLDKCLEDMITSLNSGGRLCVISFHSLEDRIVKNIFRKESTDCLCDKNLPICVCKHKASVKLINKKPIEANPKETEQNKRSSSAKLRICEKL
ncbi:MAG: 16S rRNA (cytosine(1402)-N(4))-methyltransferase RsmH [Christensenellaceae bacterium]|jgi:16S rRNA (cytosine1402-N4)-methyltransferase|nr:16S rRNA (cytosine(1402)-N(4))-methyltransferase RsmH [Christensenellaceae bacterium]